MSYIKSLEMRAILGRRCTEIVAPMYGRLMATFLLQKLMEAVVNAVVTLSAMTIATVGFLWFRNNKKNKGRTCAVVRVHERML